MFEPFAYSDGATIRAGLVYAGVLRERTTLSVPRKPIAVPLDAEAFAVAAYRIARERTPEQIALLIPHVDPRLAAALAKYAPPNWGDGGTWGDPGATWAA